MVCNCNSFSILVARLVCAKYTRFFSFITNKSSLTWSLNEYLWNLFVMLPLSNVLMKFVMFILQEVARSIKKPVWYCRFYFTRSNWSLTYCNISNISFLVGCYYWVYCRWIIDIFHRNCEWISIIYRYTGCIKIIEPPYTCT